MSRKLDFYKILKNKLLSQIGYLKKAHSEQSCSDSETQGRGTQC